MANGPGPQRDAIERALPYLLVVGLLLLGVTTLLPFLPALLWGGILSIALMPFHDWCRARLGGRSLAATLVVSLTLLLVLVVPIVGLSRALIAFFPDMMSWISESGVPSLAPDGPSASAQPEAGGLADVWNTLVADLALIRDYFGDELRPIAFWLIGEGRLIGTFVIEFALGVLLASLLMHRAAQSKSLVHALLGRVGGDVAHEMAARAVLTIRSTVLGLLGSALAQTAVASFAYWLAAVPHWPILSLATLLLSTVQIGPVLVWVPVAIWLWVGGHVPMAIFMIVWGAVVVGMTDNVVRAAVVSRTADLPALLAFLGAVGGLLTWGIVGIFLGPVIVAVCHQLLLKWLAAPGTEGAAAE